MIKESAESADSAGRKKKSKAMPKDTATQPAKKKTGRPRIHPNLPEGEKSKQSLQPGYTRATYIIRETHAEKIKDLSIFSGQDIKTIIDAALTHYLASVEEEHGPIPGRPQANAGIIHIGRKK